ncbi:16451_t:CDS:10, partial [Acaulospora colombiana]
MQSPTKTEFTSKATKPAHGSKPVFKEKFVEIYEKFFKGNDPSTESPNFWSELFLLRVNSAYLTKLIAETSQEKLLTIKNNISKIFLKSIEALKEENSKRRMNAIETLCVLLQGIFDKRFNNFSFEVINLLTGLNNADIIFPKLVDGIYSLMKDGESVEIKCEALRLAIVVVCGNNNINQNSINEYFMKNEIFDPLLKMIITPEVSHVAYDAIMLLGILVNYNKHESKNPYLSKISEIRDELIFQKIMKTIAVTCLKCRNEYIDIQDDDETNKYTVTSVLSYVGVLLPWGGNGSARRKTGDLDPELSFGQLPSTDVAILLIFYDLVNNNKKFVAHIAKSITERGLNVEVNPDDNNDPAAYDNLFYEIVRSDEVFKKLHGI